MTETKYTIQLTESQLQLIAKCVEDLHNFMAGDMTLKNTVEVMVREDKNIYKKGSIENLLTRIKVFMYPKLMGDNIYPHNGMGAEFKSQEDFIADTYQIYRELYHISAVANNEDNEYLSETPKFKNRQKPRLVRVSKKI